MALLRKSDRRRRLLVDASAPLGESAETPSLQASKTKSKVGSVEARLYTIAAERRHQRKTTDLIPKRRLAYVYTVVALMLGVLGVNLLAIYSPRWEAVIGTDGVEALAIWGPGTLAGWLGSVCWVIAAATCMQIFVIRRHRNDDYEGTYRVWGWMAIGCLVGSLICNVKIPAVIANVTGSLLSISFTDPAWLPIAVAGILSSVIVIRVLFEVRWSYGTIAWVAIAWIAMNTAVLATTFEQTAHSETAGAEFAGGFFPEGLVVGNAMLLLAIGSLMSTVTYARFVYLRANGFIKLKHRAVADEQEIEESGSEPEVKKRASAKRKSQTTSSKAAGSSSARKSKEAPKSDSPIADPVESKGPAKVPVLSIQAKVASNAQSNVELTHSTDVKPVNPPVSASEKLRALAAASRAKQVGGSETSANSQSEGSTGATVKMSKAERRKQRKNQKQARRAA